MFGVFKYANVGSWLWLFENSSLRPLLMSADGYKQTFCAGCRGDQKALPRFEPTTSTTSVSTLIVFTTGAGSGLHD